MQDYQKTLESLEQPKYFKIYDGSLVVRHLHNTKNDLVDIIDQLNYCILDVEGINRAIERFRNFIKDYETVKNAKAVNKYVSEEKSKVEHDKEDFEDNILKDLKKYDRENDFIYEQIIEKLINYIKKINEDGLKAFNETNFN